MVERQTVFARGGAASLQYRAPSVLYDLVKPTVSTVGYKMKKTPQPFQRFIILSFRHAVFTRKSIRVEHEIPVDCDSGRFLLSESRPAAAGRITRIARITLIFYSFCILTGCEQKLFESSESLIFESLDAGEVENHIHGNRMHPRPQCRYDLQTSFFAHEVFEYFLPAQKVFCLAGKGGESQA